MSEAQPGILLNMIACLTVAGASFALMLFFIMRWRSLSVTVKAYAGFWFFTVITWLFVAIRYYRIWFGFEWNWSSLLVERIVEMSVFIGGIPLFLYLNGRLGIKGWRQILLVTAVVCAAILSVIYLWLPDGINPPRYTFFSAEPKLNNVSFGIFSFLATIAWILLVIDIARGLVRRHRLAAVRSKTYQDLYSVAPLIYVTLGAVDQSKLVLDWPLIAFRALYTAAILFVYLLVTQYEQSSTVYLNTDSAGSMTDTNNNSS